MKTFHLNPIVRNKAATEWRKIKRRANKGLLTRRLNQLKRSLAAA